MASDERPYFNRHLHILRNRMAAAVFGETWSKGSILSMDETITLALEGAE